MAECLDRAFLPLADFIEESAEIEGSIIDPDAGMSMTIESVEMSMPVELDIVVDENGHVLLGAIPPLYYVDTTIFPVHHQVTLTLKRTDPEPDDD